MTHPDRTQVVDVEVGARIRLRRKSMGLSQTGLADQVGITFQQVQKYEKGTNRVGSSRLLEISRALQMKPSALFGEIDVIPVFPSENDFDHLTRHVGSAEGLSLNRAFLKINDASVRRSVIGLLKSLGDGRAG
jgi:transcriptional regulator with XRE-family HTH domain